MSCKYDNEGICDITGASCDKVFICSEDGLWIDKKDTEDVKDYS